VLGPEAAIAGAVPLDDARLIARLRRGDPAALSELWEGWKTRVWAICRGMATDTDQARALLQDLYGTLPGTVIGWSLDAPVCCQLSRHTWSRLHACLELETPAGIPLSVPDQTRAPAAAEVGARLAEVPPELRVIYLLDIFFRCPAATLAALSGWQERDVRNARAMVAFHLVSTGGAP